MNWTRKHFLAAGIALIAITNAIALAGVARNRSGEPDSELKLTERELDPSRPGGRRENTGLAVRIRWRILTEDDDSQEFYFMGLWGSGRPVWLDAAKMASLGFDTTLPDTAEETGNSFHRQLSKEVLLVLEQDGPAHQEAIARTARVAERLKTSARTDDRERAAKMVPAEKDLRSRLFVVDAGLDIDALRAKYPNRSMYAIVRGRIEPAGRWERAKGHHLGTIRAVQVDTINVPHEWHAIFEGVNVDQPRRSEEGRIRAGRFSATVSFGQRLEPWLTSFSKGQAP